MAHTVSIAMATYNGARWLRPQLESFAAQRRRPDELVISDDGSTDDTAAVVSAFAETAPFPVRFSKNETRLGFNRNFARALELTAGAVIFISDQDDVWYPNKIGEVLAALEETPDCLCTVNDQAIADGEGVETGGTVLGNVRALGRPDSWYGPGCCTTFSRALMPLLTPFPGDVVQYDHWVNALADAIGRRRILETPLQMYRRHGGNATGSVFARQNPGWRDLVGAARSTRAHATIAAKVAEVDALLARLAMPAARDLAAQGALQAGIATLEAERADYAARAAALGRGRLRRSPLVLGMLASGRYKRFSGLTTAIKDMLS